MRRNTAKIPPAPPPIKPGPPPGCTPRVIGKLCEAFEAGSSISLACQYAGIAERTFYIWRSKAKIGEEPFAEAFQKIDAANAELDVALLCAVRKTALVEGNWHAAAFLLARRRPKEFGEHGDASAPPVAAETDKPDAVSAEDAAARLEAIQVKLNRIRGAGEAKAAKKPAKNL